jgi:hypothetical protein
MASSRDEAIFLIHCRAFHGRQLQLPKSIYTLNDDPQPQVLFTFGFSNLKPAPSSVST